MKERILGRVKKNSIKQSYEIDKLKEKFAKTLTECYNVVWSPKYHNRVEGDL